VAAAADVANGADLPLTRALAAAVLARSSAAPDAPVVVLTATRRLLQRVVTEEELKQLEARAAGAASLAEDERRKLRDEIGGYYRKDPTEAQRDRISAARDLCWAGPARKPKGKAPSSTTTSMPVVDAETARCLRYLRSICTDTKIRWDMVVANIALVAHLADPSYATLINECDRTLARGDRATRFALLLPGLRDLFIKLSAQTQPGKEGASVGNYKGTVAEMRAALRAIETLSSLRRVVILLPGHIPILEGLEVPATFTQALNETLRSQDVDRIEILDEHLEFYVEVKADVDTAIDKHGKQYPDDQLLRYLAVVASDDLRAPDSYMRYPAIDIVNPSGWLRLLTAGTGRIYADLGCWLFIGGVSFPPWRLRQICDYVAGASSGCEKSFHGYYKHHHFPEPAAWAHSMPPIVTFAPDGSAPDRGLGPGTTPMPRNAAEFNRHARRDPIMVRSNQRPAPSGPIAPPPMTVPVGLDLSFLDED
jgi:hypothetical protein